MKSHTCRLCLGMCLGFGLCRTITQWKLFRNFMYILACNRNKRIQTTLDIRLNYIIRIRVRGACLHSVKNTEQNLVIHTSMSNVCGKSYADSIHRGMIYDLSECARMHPKFQINISQWIFSLNCEIIWIYHKNNHSIWKWNFYCSPNGHQ